MSSYSSLVLGETGLVSLWMLNEASGQFADTKDSNPTTSVGAGVTYGQLGLVRDDNAAVLNGTSGWATIPSSANLSITGALSVEAWVKPTLDGSTNFMAIFSRQNGTNAGGYDLDLINTGRAEFNTRGGTSANTVDTNVGSLVSGGIYHVVGTYDSGTTTQRIWLNGVKSVESTAASNALAAITALDTIGGRSPDGIAAPSALFFNGTVAAVAVYNVALTPAQVASHYAAGMPGQLARFKAIPFQAQGRNL